MQEEEENQHNQKLLFLLQPTQGSGNNFSPFLSTDAAVGLLATDNSFDNNRPPQPTTDGRAEGEREGAASRTKRGEGKGDRCPLLFFRRPRESRQKLSPAERKRRGE